MYPYDQSLKKYSRELRKNMTDAEKIVWTKIRNKQLKGYQFYREKIIGNFIVDFYCPKGNLVIEIGGGQHYGDEGKQKDGARDDFLKNSGLRFFRFSDREVFENLNEVMERIWENM